MKRLLLSLSFLLGINLIAVTMDFDAGQQDWFTPDSEVNISKVGNILKIDFTADQFTPTQHGSWLYNRNTIRVLLKKPQKLDQNSMRIIFEAFGHEYKTWNTRDEVIQIWPLICDENGEQFSYIPQKFPHLYQGGTMWAMWMTAPFFAGEAGGATQDIYMAEGGDRNARPDGKLEFLGFKIIVQTSKPQKTKTGSVMIGKIMESGQKLSIDSLYFYADSVCRNKGTFCLTGSVSRNFQTQPVAEFDKKISFDPSDPSSRKQRIELPIPPGNGHFWVEYMVTDESGVRIAAQSFRHQTIHADFSCTAEPLPPETVPVSGYIRINPERSAVYERGETPELQFRVWSRGKKQLRIQTELLSYQYADVFETKDFQADFRGTKQQVFTYKPSLILGRDAYRCRFTISDANGDVLQIKEYVFGRKSDLKQAYCNRMGRLVNRHELKEMSYNRATFHILWSDTKNIKTERDLTERFLQTLRSAGSMTRYWTYTVDPAEMEILPGVFDFAVLDKIMDIAADYGVALTLQIVHIDSNKPYRWIHYFPQFNFDGLPIFEHYYGGYSPADHEYLDVWYRLNRALFDRYGNHPAFQGYYLLQPAGEFTIEDKPWEGVVAGYEPPMKKEFQIYLQKYLKLDITALNRRWETSYRNWDEVTVPAPNFKLGKIPDLSMRWNDFCDFKFFLNANAFFPEAVRRIRSYTDRHVIILYTSPRDDLSGVVDYFHNGGNHYLQNEGRYVEAWRKGRSGWISEPHDPTRWASDNNFEWVLDWTIYMSILQAQGGGANLHLYNYPRKKLIENHGSIYAYDRMRKYIPILDELNGFVSTSSLPRIGIFQDKKTLACKHKTTFLSRLDDLARFFELVKYSKLPFVTMEKLNLSQLSLLILNPLDEVMAQENVDMIAQWVRNGGRVILAGNTGKYTPESGYAAPWVLLRALDIKPPSGIWCESGINVNADIIQKNHFFDENRKLRFYTGAEFKRDLQSEDIKARFWKFPYRWIPETDYFGYYPDHSPNGKILAKFPEGGAALSLHKTGKGEALVFWGTPDYRPEYLDGFIERAASWAGIQNTYKGNPIVFMQEGKSIDCDRHYVLLYQDIPGQYQQRILTLPDGEFFVEELVSDRKLGRVQGEKLRTEGLTLDFLQGASPLQILRITPMSQYKAKWSLNYSVQK